MMSKPARFRPLATVLATVAGLTLSLFGATAAEAQVAFGVKGGLALSNLGGNAVGNIQGRTGVSVGLFADLAHRSPTSLQLEATFTQRGAIQQGQLDLGGGLTFARGTWRYNYVDFTLLLKRKFETGPTTRVAFYAGPTMAWLTKAQAIMPDRDRDLTDFTRSTDFGTVLGASIEAIGGVVLDFRYQWGLIAIDQGLLEQHFHRKHRSVTATAGIVIG